MSNISLTVYKELYIVFYLQYTCILQTANNFETLWF